MKNTKGSQSHNKEQPQDIASNTLPGISFQLLVTWGAFSLTNKKVLIRKRQLNDSPHTSALYIFIRPEFTLSHILTELIPHKTLECSAKGPLFIWFVEKETKGKGKQMDIFKPLSSMVLLWGLHQILHARKKSRLQVDI